MTHTGKRERPASSVFTEYRPGVKHNGHGPDSADVRACAACSPNLYPRFGARHRADGLGVL